MKLYTRLLFCNIRNYEGKHKLRYALYVIYFTFFGVDDFHSHIRYRTIITKIRNMNLQGKIIDVGGGRGHLDMEIMSRYSNQLISVIYENDDFNFLRKSVNAGFMRKVNSNYEIKKGDAIILEGIPSETYGVAFIIDVLEHVKYDSIAVASLKRILENGGKAVVSVPTYDYLVFFGEKYDKEIGHVRHYSEDTLIALFRSAGFKLVEIHKYTSGYNSTLCNLYYDKLPKLRLLGSLMKLVALPLLTMVTG